MSGEKGWRNPFTHGRANTLDSIRGIAGCAGCLVKPTWHPRPEIGAFIILPIVDLFRFETLKIPYLSF
jgi:hypothetical protein